MYFSGHNVDTFLGGVGGSGTASFESSNLGLGVLALKLLRGRTDLEDQGPL